MAHTHLDEYYLERLHLLTRNEIIVFCYLLKKRNSKSNQCNPRLTSIAFETHLKPPRVTEAVKGLEAKKWIIWVDSGDFIINEKVTESVTSQVTNSVRKSYGKRNRKLRNAEVEVTQCVTSIRCTEHTKEQTIEHPPTTAETPSADDRFSTEKTAAAISAFENETKPDTRIESETIWQEWQRIEMQQGILPAHATKRLAMLISEYGKAIVVRELTPLLDTLSTKADAFAYLKAILKNAKTADEQKNQPIDYIANIPGYTREMRDRMRLERDKYDRSVLNH